MGRGLPDRKEFMAITKLQMLTAEQTKAKGPHKRFKMDPSLRFLDTRTQDSIYNAQARKWSSRQGFRQKRNRYNIELLWLDVRSERKSIALRLVGLHWRDCTLAQMAKMFKSSATWPL